MTIDPRTALTTLVAAFERHLEASAGRRSEGDPVVLAAYRDLAEAFERYDDSLLDSFDEVTPLEVFRDDEEFEEFDEDLDDDLDLAEDLDLDGVEPQSPPAETSAKA